MRKQLAYHPTSYKNKIAHWLLVELLGVSIGSWLIFLILKDTYSVQQLMLMLLFFYTLAALVAGRVLWLQYLLVDADYQVAAVNQQQTGLWLHLNGRRVFAAFTWLKLAESERKVVLKFKHALYFDKRGQPHLLAGSQLVCPRQLFNGTELTEFTATVGLLQTGKSVNNKWKVRFKPKRQLAIPRLAWLSGWGLLLVSLLLITNQSQQITKKRTAQQNARYTQVDLQPGHTIQTEKFAFTIDHAYRAERSDHVNVLILNCQVKPLDDDESTLIASYDFSIYKHWSVQAKKDYDYLATGNRNTYTTILIDQHPKRVINTLNEGFSFDEQTTQTQTFNVVFPLPQQQKFDLLWKPADLVIHVQKSELEVLK